MTLANATQGVVVGVADWGGQQTKKVSHGYVAVVDVSIFYLNNITDIAFNTLHRIGIEMTYHAQLAYVSLSYPVDVLFDGVVGVSTHFTYVAQEVATGVVAWGEQRIAKYADYGFTVGEMLAYEANMIVSNSITSVRDNVKELLVSTWHYTTRAFHSLAVRDRVIEPTSGIRAGNVGVDGERLAQHNYQQQRDGVVVVPSFGPTQDEVQKKEIEEAFSDEINIVPDADGQSGIIKPVFKNQKDQEYLYVLVPVDESGSN